MSKYIDKEKLLEKLEATRHEPWMEYNAVLGIMIAEEVVKQFEEILLPISKTDEDNVLIGEEAVLHARWEADPEDLFGPLVICSNCGKKVYDMDADQISYCPYCGAKMDMTEDNNEV